MSPQVKRPVLYVLIPFALGIVLSAIFTIPPIYVFSLGALFLATSAVYSRKNLPSHIALYLAVFFFGILHYQNSITLSGEHISRFVSDRARKVTLVGVITDDPIVSMTSYNKSKTSFVLNADSVKIGDSWHASKGLVDVRVYARTTEPLGFGRKIIIEGVISKPVGLKNPGLFDYAKYLAMKDIYAVFSVKEGSRIEAVGDNSGNPVKAAAYRLRSLMRAAIDRHFENPYNGFIKAIMIGDRADLIYDLNSDFIKTGTIHAIAISGLNVGLIAAMFMAVLALIGLPKKINLVLVACAMVLYMFVAGSSPPIVRAVIIFIVFVVGYLINRESEMLNSLAFAAFIMLLANPKELFDPSFQLSFASIAGMIIFTPKINNILRVLPARRGAFRERAKTYLLSALSASAAAIFITWPITDHYFNIISPVAFLANLVVVPALFLLTAASFLFLLAGLVPGILAGALAHGISVFCGALFTANHLLASLPLAYARVAAPSPAFMILYYTAAFTMILPHRIEFKKFAVRKSLVAILLLAFFNVLVWRDAVAMNGGGLKITFIDVGQGDSTLVELPGGRNVLIDAGPGGDAGRFDLGRSVVAPYLWNRNINRLDAVIATHFHEDHLGGIVYLLENFRVDRIMDNGAICQGSEIFDRYLRTIRAKKIRRETIGRGDAIKFDGGRILVLNPGKDNGLIDRNENSIVLKVDHGGFAALLCGDASSYALEKITDLYGKFLRSDVVKVPHHGGNLGSKDVVKDFFKAACDKIAVISVAKINKYGAPSKKTLEILNDLKLVIYETKDNGAIMVSADKESYEIKSYTGNN